MDYTPQDSLSHADKQRIEDDTYCNPNGTYVWCLPKEYNREKHPFACKLTQCGNSRIFLPGSEFDKDQIWTVKD